MAAFGRTVEAIQMVCKLIGARLCSLGLPYARFSLRSGPTEQGQ